METGDTQLSISLSWRQQNDYTTHSSLVYIWTFYNVAQVLLQSFLRPPCKTHAAEGRLFTWRTQGWVWTRPWAAPWTCQMFVDALNKTKKATKWCAMLIAKTKTVGEMQRCEVPYDAIFTSPRFLINVFCIQFWNSAPCDVTNNTSPIPLQGSSLWDRLPVTLFSSPCGTCGRYNKSKIAGGSKQRAKYTVFWRSIELTN